MNTSHPCPASETRYAAGAAASLTIEFFLDFVCPWCLIGKRHLSSAISWLRELRPDVEVRVLWRSHQLLPHIPPGGVPYQSFYIDRLGSAEAVERRRAQVREAGNPAGIAFAFEHIKVMPNTAAAHNLSVWAAGNGTEAQQSALIESLFAAYFFDGEDIGDPSVLLRRALACGLGGDGLRQHQASQANGQDGIMVSPQAGYISGVPLFVFNGKGAMSGAHPPETLLQAMLQSIKG